MGSQVLLRHGTRDSTQRYTRQYMRGRSHAAPESTVLLDTVAQVVRRASSFCPKRSSVFNDRVSGAYP